MLDKREGSLKISSIEKDFYLESQQAKKKNQVLQPGSLGDLCGGTDEATTEYKRELLLLEVSIPYLSFPATIKIFVEWRIHD